MQRFWYREYEGRIVGPVDRSTLEDLARRWIIDVKMEIRVGEHDEQGEWIQADTLPGLFTNDVAQTTPPSRLRTDDPQHVSADPNASTASSINPYQAPIATDLSPLGSPAIGHEIDTASLTLTRKGLRCLYYGICTVLIGFMGIITFSVIGTALGNRAFMALGPVISLLGCVGGLLSILIGLILCLTIPEETGARRSIQISFVCLPLVIAVNVGGVVLSSLIFRFGNASSIGLMGPFPRLISLILAFVSLIAFLRFLRHLADHLVQPAFVASATSIMRMASVMFSLYLFSQSVSFLIAIAYPSMHMALFTIGIVFLIGFLLTLLTFIRTAILVSYLTKAIPEPQ